eukprot:COSAG06_NODE_17976_length_910_cov_1.316893_2_plen_53_part_00
MLIMFSVCCVQVWANNTKHQSVIFSDNDYEIFISPDGSNHYYKVRLNERQEI